MRENASAANSWGPLAVFLTLLVGAVGALAARRRPTVWSSRIVQIVLLALALLTLIASAMQATSIFLALGLAGMAVLPTLRPRDFLVMFARPGVFDVVEQSLRKLGVAYERDGRAFHVLRPNLALRFHQLSPRTFWVSLHAAEWTPKGKLIEQVLRKFLSN